MGGLKKEINVKAIRMFFMGVLGWSPKVLMRESDIQDLADAYLGYAKFNGLLKLPQLPTAVFLKEMMQKFPDKEK